MRRTALRPSMGTRWPLGVRRHVAEHQGTGQCLGPFAGMPGECEGPIELDHLRTGGMSLKSPSVASNSAQLCSNTHHPLKTEAGRIWRPRLIEIVNRLSADCSSCESERVALRFHVPLEA